MSASDDSVVDALYSAWFKHSRQRAAVFSPHLLAALFCHCEEFYLLRVTVVLTARSDGTQALGAVVDGQVIPAAPHLRDPVKHTKPGSSYIDDWLKQANAQLLLSGACFALDLTTIQYRLEADDALHTRECGDGKEQKTLEFIAKKATSDSAYKDRVIIVFRKGSSSDPSKITGQGCSGFPGPLILMPGKYGEFRYLDGKPQYGNAMLTHELGHFMSLSHVFPWLSDRLAEIGVRHNERRYALNKANLPAINQINKAKSPSLPEITEADIKIRREEAKQWIATWPYTIDQDYFGNVKKGIPDQYGIKDTPAELGSSLALIQGDSACGGTRSYTFDRYAGSDLDPVKDGSGKTVSWKPKPGATTTIKTTLTIDDSVRSNLMSYWGCASVERRFSEDQVERMHYVLLAHRSALIGRTLVPRKRFVWVLRFPYRLRRIKPIPPPLVDLLLALWFFALRLVAPRVWRAWRVFSECIVQPAHRWDGALQRRSLEALERQGLLQAMIADAAGPDACAVKNLPAPEAREAHRDVDDGDAMRRALRQRGGDGYGG